MEHSNPNKIDLVNFVPYALGGRSSFTVQANGKYHYKVTKKEGPVWFVYASENGRDWKYFGHISADQQFWQDKKSEYEKDDKIVVCWWFVWTKAQMGEECNLIEVWHDGICSRCGRKLTDEESVKRGLGPTCYLAED